MFFSEPCKIDGMTAMQLVLIRHATAETRSETGADIDRNLSDLGQRQAYRVGRWLKENDLLPSAVICSPAARTRQTWAQIVEATRSGVAIELEPEIYEARVETLMEVLSRAEANVPRVALVGHAPGVPQLAYDLDDGSGTLRDELARGFAPASVAVVELDVPVSEIGPGVGRLIAHLDGDSIR